MPASPASGEDASVFSRMWMRRIWEAKELEIEISERRWTASRL